RGRDSGLELPDKTGTPTRRASEGEPELPRWRFGLVSRKPAAVGSGNSKERIQAAQVKGQKRRRPEKVPATDSVLRSVAGTFFFPSSLPPGDGTTTPPGVPRGGENCRRAFDPPRL